MKTVNLKEKRKSFSLSKQQKKTKGKNKKSDSLSPSQSQLNNLIKEYQDGQYDAAEKLAVSFTQKFPEYQFGWKILGAIYVQTGRKLEAVTAAQEPVKLAPQDPEAQSILGNTLQDLSRLNEAEASFRQAILLKSNFFEAYYNLGNTLRDRFVSSQEKGLSDEF